MNFSNLISSKKHLQIKKQVIIKKASLLLSTNEYVLFFHYNGLRECNWQQIKEKIYERVECKILLLKSNLSPFIKKGGVDCDGIGVDKEKGGKINKKIPFYLKDSLSTSMPSEQEAQEKLKWGFLLKGPTLLVACSSAKELAILVETCTPPSFLYLGGIYKKHPINHLDIKRLALLGNGPSQVYPALLNALVEPLRLLLLLQSPGLFLASLIKFREDKEGIPKESEKD